MIFLVKDLELSEDVSGLRFLYFDGRKGPYRYSIEEGLEYLFDYRSERKVSSEVFHQIMCKMMIAKERIPFSFEKKEKLLNDLDQLRLEKIIDEEELVNLRLQIQNP